MLKKFLKIAAVTATVALLMCGGVFLWTSAKSVAPTISYPIMIDGNPQHLKTGDIVSLKPNGSTPAELKNVKVSAVSNATINDLFKFQREGIPAASLKKPVKVSLALTKKQSEAYFKLEKINLKISVVCRSGDLLGQELLKLQNR